MRESILEALDKKVKDSMPVEATIPVADADAIAVGEEIKEKQKKAFEEAGLGDTELPRMFLNRKIPEEPKPVKDANLKKAYLSEDLFEDIQLDEDFSGKYSNIFKSYAEKLFFENDTSALKYLIDQLIRYCKEEDLKDLWFDRMQKVSSDAGYIPDDEEDDAIVEGFKKFVDLDRVIMDVSNMLDESKLGKDWIEVFPVSEITPYKIKVEVTGPDENPRKAIISSCSNSDCVEFSFYNGASGKFHNTEELAQFIKDNI